MSEQEVDEQRVQAEPQAEGEVRKDRVRVERAGGLGSMSMVRFILFLGALGVCYIWMRNSYEKLWRREQALEEQVRNLRSESVTLSAALMSQSKESAVVELVARQEMELVESRVPPVKIEYKER